ncbi:MAG: 5-formyltetrahydrofolate cyclo-ligase [Pseudomonadota bacterium]
MIAVKTKKELRKELRFRRRIIEPAESEAAAEAAASLFTAQQDWQQLHHIAVYLAADGELDCAPLVRRARTAQKTLYLPNVEDGQLLFVPWEPEAALEIGRYGIATVRGSAVAPQVLDAVISPLVGFSRFGFRLGMGGGFYDRFFESAPKSLLRIGWAFEAQHEDALEHCREATDQDLNKVVTEVAVHSFVDKLGGEAAKPNQPGRERV